MKHLSCKILLFLLLPLSTVFPQTLEEAKALFAIGKYQEAKVAFETLLKKTPNNASVNYYYGATCFKLNDWTPAEKHLKTATTQKVFDAYPYLGDLYFQQYRFSEATDAYQKYVTSTKKDPATATSCEKKLKKAKLGESMLKRIEQVRIIDSTVVDKNNFLAAYKLSKTSGKLFTYNDFFKKSNVDATVFMTERGSRILYAEPTENDGYDLFSQDKLLDNYGNAKKLNGSLNTKYDENYPFMLNDGVTVYYASTDDETSLGGYDIFITRYNLATDTYLSPENMGMPFNSPFNDYMMAIDETNGVGWFASDRYQPENKVCIYLFIPNNEKIILRNNDENYLRNMAKINSIKDTWNEGEDYVDLLNRIYRVQQEQKEDSDFHFVVADGLIYKKLSDFKSATAKDLFLKAQGLEKQLNDLQASLNGKRMEYETTSTSKKTGLTNSILDLETQVNALQDQPEEFYIKARNEEVRFLMKK